MRARRPIFTMRPWQAADGEPGSPQTVDGIPVAKVVCRRTDGAGALVGLADGRYALTGSTVVMGPAGKLEGYLRRHRPSQSDEDRSGEEWYRKARNRLVQGRSARPNSVQA